MKDTTSEIIGMLIALILGVGFVWGVLGGMKSISENMEKKRIECEPYLEMTAGETPNKCIKWVTSR